MRERWYCPDCGKENDSVVVRTYYTTDRGKETLVMCPWCGGDSMRKMVECPSCHEWMEPDDRLCHKCREHVEKSVKKFLRQFNEAELEYVDYLFDGVSVRDLL